MQEYCVYDIGKRRRIEEMNEKMGRNRDGQNQYQSDQAKTSKAVNTVSGDEARDSWPQNNRGGRSDRSNSSRGRKENSGWKQKVPYCCIHGRDKGHWTNECPLIKEKKELERATNNDQLSLAIRRMRPPSTKKDVQKLPGSLASLNRFISRSVEKSLPFFKVLKGSENFHWGPEQAKAFEDLKRYLENLAVMTTQLTEQSFCCTSQLQAPR